MTGNYKYVKLLYCSEIVGKAGWGHANKPTNLAENFADLGSLGSAGTSTNPWHVLGC